MNGEKDKIKKESISITISEEIMKEIKKILKYTGIAFAIIGVLSGFIMMFIPSSDIYFIKAFISVLFFELTGFLFFVVSK